MKVIFGRGANDTITFKALLAAILPGKAFQFLRKRNTGIRPRVQNPFL